MGKPAARLLAVAGHGGNLVLASTTVFIGGMPAARKGDPLGNDGVRSGLIVKGEAGADVLQGEGVGTATTPAIFGLNMQAKGKASAAAGTTAIGGGWLYYDHAEGRLHISVSGKLGAGLEAGISIGRKYKDPTPPAPAPPTLPAPPRIDFLNTPGFGTAGIPGTVVSGCMTVLIGG